MLTEKQAIEKMKETRDAYSGMRRALDSFWTIALMYDSAEQWGYATTDRGRSVLKHLRTIVDPDRNDVRVVMDQIHSKVVRIGAALKPKRIDASTRPATTSPSHLVISRTSDRLLERWCEQIGALDFLREKESIRDVLGEVIIRRTLSQRGSSRDVPVQEERETLLRVRNFRLGWSLCYPWEFIRDPSATTLRFDRDEEFICHAKPRPISWIKRFFGVDLSQGDSPVETTMGELLEFQKQIFRAHGTNAANHIANSREKGVLVYEAYYKDRDQSVDSDERRDWAWQLIAWEDPKGNKDDVRAIHFGPNPFYGVPFHAFVYDTQVQAPWARGIPHILRQAQDINNLAWTWAMRLQQAGSGKIIIEQGTVEKPSESLNSDMRRPLVWNRARSSNPQFAQAPSRLQPPQMNPAMSDILRATPDWMEEALNLSEVQRGIGSKRGESGAALKLKLSEANVPLEDMRRSDELVLQELLYCTLVDLTNPKYMRLDQAQEILGADVPTSHAMMLLRSPITTSISSVHIQPSTLRPKTPYENRDEITTLVTSQVIDAETAQWEMTMRGVSPNSLMSGSRQEQMTEIELMIGGEDVPVHMAEEHKWHRRTITEFASSSQWMVIDDEAKQRIQSHDDEHMQAQILRAQAEMMAASAVQMPNQGSPPAGAAQDAASQPPGLVGSAMSVA